MDSALHPADVVVIGVYLAAVVGKGVVLARGQRSVEDYFLAGRRMRYWVIAVSVLASLLSGITYLGAPTEAFVHDLKFSLILLCICLATPVVIYVFLPFYYKLGLYTAYEYLERRFSLGVRLIASGMFIFWRLGWMALVIFAPSLAISTVLGVDWRVSAVVVGLASTAYTVMGGMAAVMWTDVIQFFVLYGGALLVIATAVARTDGGVWYLWSTAAEAGKLTLLDWTWDPRVRVTTWAIIFGGSVGALAAYTTDQVAIQRYLTARDFNEAKRSLVFHALIIVPVSFVFYLLGVVIWGFYQQRPELLAALPSEHPDRILPLFVLQQLPVGIRGAIVAALFAATMSSVDSGINSLTTATLVDFYDAGLKRRLSEAARLALARKWTVVWGMAVTAIAIAAGMWGETLLEMSNKVSGLFAGPLLGVFLLGMKTRMATWRGALVGAGAGLAAALATAFGKALAAVAPEPASAALRELGRVTFLYYPTIGFVVTVVVGMVASLLWRRELQVGRRGPVSSRGAG